MNCINDTSLENDTDPDIHSLDSVANVSSASKLVNYYITDVAMPATCALGILGNLLSLMVLTTEKLHRTLSKMEISAHIGLTALAVSDFLFCLLVLIVTQVPPKKHYEVGDPVIFFHLMSNGLITIFIISSTWLIVVMAAERYIAVCHPLQARKLISLRRTRASIILVFLICTLATIPIFLESTIEEGCAQGRSVRRLQDRDEDASRPLQRLVWSIFFDFIPCAALIYFNLCLIIQIRRAKQLRDQMTPRHSVLRYSTSNPKEGKPKQKPAHEVNGERSFHQQKKRDRNALLETNPAPNEASVIEMTNGASKYVKYVTNKPRDSKSSHGNESQGNESTQNELRDLHHIAKPSRPYQSPSSSKRLTDSIVRKRPSDNALNSVTATLVAVILLFLLLVSPSELLKFSVEHTSADETQKRIVMSVTNFMQVLNFSLNFVLYCAVNKTFRHTLYGLICCCWLTLRR
uniref:G-protein coupled receptors family 1 profile domain-containing protein n=1 Tax=Biomphalaria glabrata TaxID=6526 RepID=A0A2C9KHK6_BIOGL